MLVLRAQWEHHHGVRMGNQKKNKGKRGVLPKTVRKICFFFKKKKCYQKSWSNWGKKKTDFEHPGKETWKSEKMKKWKNEEKRNLASHAKCWMISRVCRCCFNLFQRSPRWFPWFLPWSTHNKPKIRSPRVQGPGKRVFLVVLRTECVAQPGCAGGRA